MSFGKELQPVCAHFCLIIELLVFSLGIKTKIITAFNVRSVNDDEEEGLNEGSPKVDFTLKRSKRFL